MPILPSIQFPITVTYDESTGLPPSIIIVEENPDETWSITITWEDYNKFRIDLQNVAGIVINVEQLLKDLGISEDDVRRYVDLFRTIYDRVLAYLSGTGELTTSIKLPRGWTPVSVLLDRVPVSYDYDAEENKITLTISFASTRELEIKIKSTLSELMDMLVYLIFIVITLKVAVMAVRMLEKAVV